MTEVPEGHLVSMSYSQTKVQKTRAHAAEAGIKRLLVFSKDRIFIDSFLPSNGTFKDVFNASPDSGDIIYGSFVHNHKLKHFVTLNALNGQYFVRTHTITEESSTEEAKILSSDKNKKRLFKKLRQLDPGLFNQWVEQIKGHDKNSVSVDHTMTQPDHEPGYTINQREERELTEFKNQPLSCVRMIKNTASGQSELIISGGLNMATVTVNKRSILLIKSQVISGKLLGIEYWGGYYFSLHENNKMKISKRGISGKLEEIKTIDFSLGGVPSSIRITHIKVPMLEWTGRLPDILHKDLPAHVLLVGQQCEIQYGSPKPRFKTQLIKYSIYTNDCVSTATVESEAEITAVNYGPYDNGPAMIGLSDGTVIIYDYYSLDIVRKLKTIGTIKWLTYEPGNAIIVGTDATVYKYNLTDSGRIEKEKLAMEYTTTR